MPKGSAMREMRLFLTAALWVVVAFLLGGCDESEVYHHYVSTPISGWEKNDTLEFNIPRLACTDRYREEIDVRISNEYPFKSISLVIEQQFFPGKRVKRDVLHCQFTDAKGHFKGDGTNFYQYRYVLDDIVLRRNDSVRITIKHDMKREIMPGISDVGVRLTRKSALTH